MKELDEIKARAKRDKQAVTVLRGSKFGMGGKLMPKGMRGFDVYVHPLWLDICTEEWTHSKRQRYWVAWFWKIGGRR